ncbi:MAG: nitroreductase family protein [Bacteroidia bacterium]
MELVEQLNWRYAAKRMTGKKVDAQKIDNILEATRLSASSGGLQPYTIIMIENENLRKQISQDICKQPQITEASHLLVFCAWTKLTEKEIDDYLNLIVTTRGVTLDSLAPFRTSLVGMASRFNEEQCFNWSSRQLYIALGTALAAAAMEEVDCTPMEGFNALALDEFLKLKDKNLRSVALLPIGYRDEANDFLAKAKKVRRAKENLFIEITDTSLS